MRKIFIAITLLVFIISACTPTVKREAVAGLAPTFTKTYYISPGGNDSNPGTQADPFKTLQKCLGLVKTGQACRAAAGTYNEALTLVTAGTQSAPIGFICDVPLGCTINSGTSRSLITNGAISNYVIDGFRFISTLIDISHPSKMGTVNFAYDFWGDGAEFERGNDGFTLRNCYIEGAIWIYGSDNLIENCELNGNGIYSNGLIEGYHPSQNNVFRNNIIHDYTQRGGWSLHATDNTLWEGNTIYNNGTSGSGEGIDCDGAGDAVLGCNTIGNLIYNIQGEAAILLENCFTCEIKDNIIRDSLRGVSAINYNINNGSDPFKSDEDYKGLMTNTVIRNNVIYNITKDSLLCKAVRGNTFVNNTIYNTKNTSYWGAIGLASYTSVYCPDWIITNNIVAKSAKNTIWYEGSPAGVFDYNFYTDPFSVSLYNAGSKDFAGWQGMGKDSHSKKGNAMFINAAGGDFHLQPNSPACGMGAFPCAGAASSPTPSETGINSPVVTNTPSLTRTPTTAPPTPTRTPSRTPTATKTASNTPTVTPSPTITPIPTVPACAPGYTDVELIINFIDNNAQTQRLRSTPDTTIDTNIIGALYVVNSRGVLIDWEVFRIWTDCADYWGFVENGWVALKYNGRYFVTPESWRENQ